MEPGGNMGATTGARGAEARETRGIRREVDRADLESEYKLSLLIWYSEAGAADWPPRHVGYASYPATGVAMECTEYRNPVADISSAHSSLSDPSRKSLP